MPSFRIVLLLLFAAAIQVATSPLLHAEAELSLSQGAASVVVLDNGPGDTNSALGAITFTGSVGNFNGSFGVGETKPFIGGAGQPQLTLMSTNITTGTEGGTLTILFGDTNFGPVTNGIATAHIGGITTLLTGFNTNISLTAGQISYSTFADNTNSVLGLATPVTTQGPFTGATFDSNATGNIAFGLNTALTQQVVITQGPGVLTGFNSTLRITNAVAIPDDGSAIVLLAGAVAALELLRRRLHFRSS